MSDRLWEVSVRLLHASSVGSGMLLKELFLAEGRMSGVATLNQLQLVYLP